MPPRAKAAMLMTDRMRSSSTTCTTTAPPLGRRCSRFTRTGPRISKGSPFIYVDPEADVMEKRNLHANDAQSLFFYLENMQATLPTAVPPLDLHQRRRGQQRCREESVRPTAHISK